MHNSQTVSESLLRSWHSSAAVLSSQVTGGTEIDLHIESACQLVNVLLEQIEALISQQKRLDDRPNLNLRDELRRYEIELIQNALIRTRGHQARAAKLLGVNATTLNEKIKRYQIQWRGKINSAQHPPSQLKAESCEGVC
jgi:DNA-binding NtrC family response regulator